MSSLGYQFGFFFNYFLNSQILCNNWTKIIRNKTKSRKTNKKERIGRDTMEGLDQNASDLVKNGFISIMNIIRCSLKAFKQPITT